MKKTIAIDYSTLINKIADGVIIFNYDDDFAITYINDSFVKITGYSRKEIFCIAKYISLIIPEDQVTFLHSIKEQLYNSNRYSVEYRMQKKDGSVIWLLAHGFLEDNIIQSSITNITEQKKREQYLSEKIYALKQLNNNIPAGIVYGNYDEDYTVTYGNDGFFSMIGYTREQFKKECNNSMGVLVHPEDKEQMAENLNRQLSLGKTAVATNRLVRRDGSFIWILALSNVTKTAEGNLVFHGVCSDITQQKEVEDALRILEKKYEIAIRLSDVTTFDYDVRTKHITTKQMDSKIFGMAEVYSRGVEEIILSGLIAKRSIEALRNLYKEIDAGKPSGQATIVAYDLNGQERIIDLQMITVFDKQGNPIRAVGVRKDITETLLLQREKEYGNIMTLNQLLTYEVNITSDKIIYLNEEWSQRAKLFNITNFSQLIDCMCQHIVAKEHHHILREKLSTGYIQHSFEAGQKTISIEYKRKVETGKYRWFQKNINIIKDPLSSDIIIRCYIFDIHEKKEHERKAREDQKIYNTMLYKADVVYGVNLTQDLAVSGHEKWLDTFSIEPSSNYTEMIKVFSEKTVHPEDKEIFLNTFSRQKLLLKYNNMGQTEYVTEYRRLEKGAFVWVRCSMYLFEDTESSDVKAHCYLENIHEEKIKELNLIYRSEHDLLTDCYNKAATEKYCTEFLSSAKGISGKHAFFIIDIDHFKEINDNFGHAFGDIILSRTSRKIKNLFRDQDIIGRIGGDEFVVLMKNIHDSEIVQTKAQDICNEIVDIFNNNGKSYNISASVGIAFYGEHGDNYDELYRHSDTALYACKKAGRNQFTIYCEQMSLITADPKLIEKNNSSTYTTNNITEYLFKILYETEDKELAIQCALEFIGRQYDLSRVYIFEEDLSCEYICNTYNWHSENTPPPSEDWEKLSCEEIGNYKINFDKEGIFDLSAANQFTSTANSKFISADAKNLWHFAIMKNNFIKGFVGFDDCVTIRTCNRKEIYDLQNIAKIVSDFILAMREYNNGKNIKIG